MPSPTAVSDALAKLAKQRRFIGTPWSGDDWRDRWVRQRLMAPPLVLPAVSDSELKLTAAGFVARSWLIPLGDDEGDNG